MAQNNSLIFSADPVVGGGLRVAPVGTDLSTVVPAVTASTDLTAPAFSAWVDLGNMGDEGFVEKLARKNDKKRNFGGDIVKIVQSEFDATLSFDDPDVAIRWPLPPQRLSDRDRHGSPLASVVDQLRRMAWA